MIPVEHSNAVQTATAVVVAEMARAMILAIDMTMESPPSPKIEINPTNCCRGIMFNLVKRKNGRLKTIIRKILKWVLLNKSQMMFEMTDGKKTPKLGELRH